jgi:hypothetical protein
LLVNLFILMKTSSFWVDGRAGYLSLLYFDDPFALRIRADGTKGARGPCSSLFLGLYRTNTFIKRHLLIQDFLRRVQ